jgi:hypothetical protein
MDVGMGIAGGLRKFHFINALADLVKSFHEAFWRG